MKRFYRTKKVLQCLWIIFFYVSESGAQLATILYVDTEQQRTVPTKQFLHLSWCPELNSDSTVPVTQGSIIYISHVTGIKEFLYNEKEAQQRSLSSYMNLHNTVYSLVLKFAT